TGGGNFELDAAKTATITVDKALAIPFTQITMDSEQIMMTVLPYMTTIVITAAGVSIESPTITLQAMAAITLNAPIVNVPGMLNVGFLNATAGTASGLPL